MLTFQSFDLEGAINCDDDFFNDDFVQVIFGSVAEKYCGSKLPSPIISSGNNMTVFFHSNEVVHVNTGSKDNGFEATWKAVDTSGTLS